MNRSITDEQAAVRGMKLAVKIAYFGIIVVSLALGLDARAQESADKWRFQKGGLSISVVAKDAEYDDRRSYQIVVEDDIRMLSRLEVNRDAVLTNAWQTDLDGDGAFEIVVTTGQVNGSNSGGVDIHEWNGNRFDSMRPKRSTDAERVGYQGYDQFELHEGTLIRSYPIFITHNGNWAPSGDMARYVFHFADRAWVKEK